MGGIFLTLSRTIDRCNQWIGKAAAWAIVVAILVSAMNALSRHLMGVTSNAWLELQWYLFGAVFMLCASWTMQDNEHVRIDVLSSQFSKKTREIVDMFGHLFFLFPFVALMLWLSVPFFLKAFISREMSPNDGGLLLWPAKCLILVGFAQLALQWFSEVIKSGFRIKDLFGSTSHEVSQ